MPSEFEEIVELKEVDVFRASSLCVGVEFLELMDRYGEEETWVILGKLKDLLG